MTLDIPEGVKKALKIVTSAGTGIILGNTVTLSLPKGTPIVYKFVCYIASQVVGGMIADKSEDYIDGEVDSFTEEFKNMVNPKRNGPM